MKNKLVKTLLLVAVGGVVLLGAAYAGYRGYKSVRQARLVREARGYLEQHDLRKAQLCLQRAIRYNNRDLDTCRLMAQLAEASSSRAALLWRGRVVELHPGSLDDQLALARTALSFRDYATATNALAGVNASGKQTAAFHEVAGDVAAAVNQIADAEAHYREAIQLSPQNIFSQLSLAGVQLRQTNAPALTEARVSLKRIAANPTNSALRCLALRLLTVDALRGNQSELARDLSGRLLQETNSVFRDRLLRLEVLKATHSDQFKPALAGYEQEAGTNGAAVFEMALWQITTLGPADTLKWLGRLPAEAQKIQPTALLIADCLAATRNWAVLQTNLSQQSWGDLEFLRYAYRARALRGLGLPGAAKGEWELALKASGNQLRSLMDLRRYAVQQQWDAEAEDILWTIVRRYPTEQWAREELSQALYVTGRTRPLMTFYSQELQLSPNNPGAKNNLALTALLLEATEFKPHVLALEVYQKSPTNAAYASTYAFSLYLQSKNAEALKILQSLSPKALEDPSVAGYYGLVLKATGARDKAKIYLNWAMKARLLPEERKLFERALVGI